MSEVRCFAAVVLQNRSSSISLAARLHLRQWGGLLAPQMMEARKAMSGGKLLPVGVWVLRVRGFGRL